MLDVLLLLEVGAVVEPPAAALWWAYFDLVMLAAEQRLSAAKGKEQVRLARDSYSYLHLPTVAGIVLGALGIKKTLAHVRDSLETIPAAALCGSVALYLLGHNAFRPRDVGSVSVPRLAVTIFCCALIPVAARQSDSCGPRFATGSPSIVHEALTPSPTRSVLLGHHRLTRRGSVAQASLYIETCIELQDCLRLSVDAQPLRTLYF